ncbi:MAG: hypothetical protein P8X64_11670 [Anaerolineales bacterium]
MSFRRLVFLLTILAVFTMAVRVSVDSDTWWHLRAGKTILDQGAILERDPYSLTRQGEPWEYPGWLAEIALYGTYNLFGFAGLNLLTALAVTAAFGMLWRVLEGGLLLRSAVLLLAAITSAVYWSARPQIFSFTLSATYILILEHERRSPSRLLWLLPLLMALWVNLHGGFAIGFILIALYLAGTLISAVLDWNQGRLGFQRTWERYRERILRLVGVGLLGAVFLGLNPHGFSMLSYPFKTVSIGALQSYIQEWQTPDFHQAQVQPFLLMMLLSIVAIAGTKRGIKPTGLVLLLAFMAMALMAARNVALYALVAAPFLARHLDSAASRLVLPGARGQPVPERRARVINLVLFVVLLLPASFKIMIPLTPGTNEEAIRKAFPEAAVEYLRTAELPGPIFNSYNWGAYLIWTLYPEYLSFVDGRTDLFDDELLRQYLITWRAQEGWRDVLDRWGIATVLLEPDAPLSRVLAESDDWSTVFADDQAVVLTRRPEG